jgi:hypothetical protein
MLHVLSAVASHSLWCSVGSAVVRRISLMKTARIRTGSRTFPEHSGPGLKTVRVSDDGDVLNWNNYYEWYSIKSSLSFWSLGRLLLLARTRHTHEHSPTSLTSTLKMVAVRTSETSATLSTSTWCKEQNSTLESTICRLLTVESCQLIWTL